MYSILVIIEVNRYLFVRKKLCEISVNKIKEKVGFYGSYF